MDCSSARLFLHFNRPGGHDLDGPDAEELNLHLAQCTECNALARADRRLDQHLGRAMRAVEVPPGLREEIRHCLEAERTDWYRHWLAYAARGGAAAAVLLAVVWGSFYLYTRPPKQLAADQVVYAFNVTPPGDAADANRPLHRLGSRRCAPDFVNYAYLTGVPSMAVLPGYEGENVQAAQFVFTRDAQGKGRTKADRVVIFVVNLHQFQIGELENSTHGYNYNLEVYRESDVAAYAYLVLYTGESWEWLKALPKE